MLSSADGLRPFVVLGTQKPGSLLEYRFLEGTRNPMKQTTMLTVSIVMSLIAGCASEVSVGGIGTCPNCVGGADVGAQAQGTGSSGDDGSSSDSSRSIQREEPSSFGYHGYRSVPRTDLDI